MRRLIPLSALLLCCYTAFGSIVPTPKIDNRADGTFTLNRATTLTFDHSLSSLADYLREYISIGQSNERFSADNAIILNIDPTLGAEAYTLDIHPQRVVITGGDYGGAFNGVQTLFQLLPSEVYEKSCPLPAKITCRKITDAPRFEYRGMMLDVARTWSDAARVKRQIDLLSYHKINKLHLHLTDDEGWRIEIKSHPELTEIGGYRGGDSPIESVYGKWGEKYGGFFTQEQMREIIAYAAQRNIEIIPEIDLPGHSRNIAHVHPEILCNYKPNLDRSNGYDMRSAWCVSKEANYNLLDDILSEICSLFPSKYIHIGGDEVELSQWRQCPDCQALYKRKKMTDMHQLQDIFMQRLNDILLANGKQPAAWNEAINGGSFTKNSLIYGWQDVKTNLKATESGYKCVVMPSSHFYIDMRQSTHEEGHSWAAIFDAEKVYSFDFTKQGFSDSQMKNVLGLEAAFWSEAYVSHTPETADYLDYMSFPRLCSLAEVAWSDGSKNWDAFYKTLTDEHYDRMAGMGIRFRLFPPKITYNDGVITLTKVDDATIHYTDDGYTEPTAESPRYTSPIKTTKPHLYRFRAIYKSGVSPTVATSAYYRTITPALTLSTSMGESAKIPYANVNVYKTFARTQRACRKGDYILYSFAQAVKCREIYLQTGHSQLPKTIITTGDVELSTDGVNFTKVAELEMGSVVLRSPQPFKAIRIVSTTTGNGCDFVTIQTLKIKPVL